MNEREPTMDSEEMNRRIYKLDGKGDLPYEAFGGKAIPYIGWFWRNVNFDRVDQHSRYGFGVIPTGDDGNDRPLIGFMQNNKWDYDYVWANQEQWDEIKRLIVVALTTMAQEDFKHVDETIQALHKP